MRKKILLLAVGSLFLLQLVLFFGFEKEQSTTAEVPHISEIAEEAVVVRDDKPAADEMKEKTLTNEVEALTFAANPSAEYYAMNPDYVGWLTVGGADVDYPVVRGQDNEFYLEHDFYKNEHVLGSIFMDYRNIGMGHDQHTILYGHHAKSGLMFGELDRYLSETFIADNQEFEFADPYTDRTYRIFSVHVAPADSAYIQTAFGEGELTDYYHKLKEASAYPIESTYNGQKLITLISCNYTVDDGRIYVHAYEIND